LDIPEEVHLVHASLDLHDLDPLEVLLDYHSSPVGEDRACLVEIHGHNCLSAEILLLAAYHPAAESHDLSLRPCQEDRLDVDPYCAHLNPRDPLVGRQGSHD